MQDIMEKIQELSPELRREVYDFVDFLALKRPIKKQRKLRLSWAGALREFRDQYDSIALQKKALEWWGD